MLTRKRPSYSPGVGFGGLVVLWLVAMSAPAQGQGRAHKAAAVQLFDEGDRLMQEGQYRQACAKLAESNRLDPQLGALLYLAECYELNGQLASAWASYREAEEVALKRGDPRASGAAERARALAPRLTRMSLSFPPGPRPAGYVVTRDGMRLAEPLWDTALPVDPGKHEIEVSAPGYRGWRDTVEVSGEGDTVAVEIPALSAEPAQRAPVVGRGPGVHRGAHKGARRDAPRAASGVAEGDPSSTTSGRTMRMAALLVGGAGLVGLGVAGYFSVSAADASNRAAPDRRDPLCSASGYCTPEGKQLLDDAFDDALVASVASVVGVAALVGATVLWLTAPSGTEQDAGSRSGVDVTIAPRPEGVSAGLSGRF